MFLRVVRSFRRLARLPYRREAIQSGTLMGVGDLIAQNFIEKKNFDNLNFCRTGRFFMIGAVLIGPALGKWYRILHDIFGQLGKLVAVKKVTVDQLFFAPIFTGIVLSAINYTNYFSVEDMLVRLQEDYPDIIKNNYKVWPAVQLLNFYLIPLKFQVFVVQIIAVFWNTYISWKTNVIND